jgi:L-asparaginase II
MNPILFELHRGKVLESVHRGRWAVVEGRRIVAKAGDVNEITFMRSSAKPFQAIAVVESGAVDAYGLGEEELSIVCGSHYGEAIHVRAAASILGKAGLTRDDLRCGIHPPSSTATQRALAADGLRPNVLHNNCSGKHAGMVAAAKKMGVPIDGYLDPAHPLQKANRRNLARHAGVRESSLRLGIDGCSAPTFGLPVAAMARAFASLTAPEVGAAERRITSAMMNHPEMIGHPCEELMKAAPGRIVGKVGAEGVYGLGFPGRAIGLAVKIDDGSTRPLLAVVVGILTKLKLLDRKELAALGALVKEEQRNHAGIVVGRNLTPARGLR